MGIDEMDYVVQTLLDGDLIDPQLLLAIRRHFAWNVRRHSTAEDCRGSAFSRADYIVPRRGIFTAQ